MNRLSLKITSRSWVN